MIIFFCSDDLGNNILVGSLRESTEIVVKPIVITSDDNDNDENNIDQKLSENVETGSMNQSDFIPITKYHHHYIYRTIFVDDTLLESDYIYDYCALISKAHMIILFKNDNLYSLENSFVKISSVHKLDQIKRQNSQNKREFQNPSVIIRLCPLDSFMNKVEKVEVITWPTIYVTKTLSKMLGLKMNSKVVLEPITQIDNEICNVQNIVFSPLKEMVSSMYI